MGLVVSGSVRTLYLHGFASGPMAFKGNELCRRLAPQWDLELPDLNRPSFSELSAGAMLAHLDGLIGDEECALIGSSLGGWLAARWAQLHGPQVKALVLLCPGFGLRDRWPSMFGAEAMARWQAEGSIVVPGPGGVMSPLHYGFFEELGEHPAAPEVPSRRTVIVHGVGDEVVPIEGSRAYAEANSVRLVEVDDDHGLASSVERIEEEVRLLWSGL